MKEHWNLSKVTLLAVCLFISVTSILTVVLIYSPKSEILLHVSLERLFFYSSVYGVSFLISGEIIGLFASSYRNLIWRKIVLSTGASMIAVLALILTVWSIEFEFIGRFAVLKIILLTGAMVFTFLFILDQIQKDNPWRILPLLPDSSVNKLKERFNSIDSPIDWIPPVSESSDFNLIDYCRDKNVDIVVRNDTDSELDVLGLLATGVRVINVSTLWEIFAQKIPHTEISKDWLSKLDLRQNDPVVRRAKRVIDILFAILGLLISLPIMLVAFTAIALESGFPIFFKQVRTGYLGQPYVLFKLRTMMQDAERGGAEWASKQDQRVTHVGRFLRRTRIDEIPQFWNVIRGDMSIVGPRPERPELEEEITRKLPLWHCRYLLKPGLTGWAQIKYQYASDLETTEEKLAYDLFYVKNASFFLDVEIILSTLRSITKGSR